MFMVCFLPERERRSGARCDEDDDQPLPPHE
jgi:hypothetical protein